MRSLSSIYSYTSILQFQIMSKRAHKRYPRAREHNKKFLLSIFYQYVNYNQIISVAVKQYHPNQYINYHLVAVRCNMINIQYHNKKHHSSNRYLSTWIDQDGIQIQPYISPFILILEVLVGTRQFQTSPRSSIQHISTIT